MDSRDLEIVKALVKDARTPLTAIAKQLGVSEAAVRKRLAKLEREGVIEGYSAKVNPSKLGFTVVALVGVDVAPERYLEVASQLARLDEVKALYLTSGDHMVMMEVWARDGRDLMKFLSEKVSSLPGVLKVCPSIVIDRVK